MELWIRTQENDLSIVADIIAPTTYDEKNWHLSAYTSKGRYIILGHYESEQRALEVLDEIQVYIKNNIARRNSENGYNDWFSCTVYEMPKE